MFSHRRKSAGPCAAAVAAARIVVLAGTAAALLSTVRTAEAQGIFDSLFGPRWSPPNAYADPNANWNPFGWRAPDAPRADADGVGAYCVRLCDGRFFPVAGAAGASPAQTCSAFCPASPTRVYHGSSIEQAVAQDGRRYAELSTAFVYRQKIVADCTCNGKDAFGLVNTRIENDATLRPGDIVATNSGLMAYNGGAGGPRRAASFTPIQSYSGVSAELRRKLTETRTTPAMETAAPPTRPADRAPIARNTNGKRVEADR